MKTVGTELMKEKFGKGIVTNDRGEELMCVAALREDSRNLLVAIGEMADGTDDKILNTLIGQQVAKLPGLPRYMSPTELFSETHCC